MEDRKSAHIGGFYTVVAAVIGIVGTLGAVFLAHRLNNTSSTDKEAGLAKPQTEVLDPKLSFRDTIDAVEKNISVIAEELEKNPNEDQADTITIRGQLWTTKNLDVNVPGSLCYNDDTTICNDYGRLYSWDEAKIACESLGPGWDLPSYAAWMNLAMEFGGFQRLGNDIGNPRESYRNLSETASNSYKILRGGKYNKVFSSIDRN